MKEDLDRQLRRQSLWLKDSWQWILKEKILLGCPEAPKPSALDVGCGPGFVMQELAPLLDVQGMDIDPDMVASCKARLLKATKGRAEDLPFEDKSFDIVYCSFLLLWIKHPEEVIQEMKRVSKGWIICFAEPDFGARIDFPQELSPLHGLITEGITKDGGDPFVGRKLRSIFRKCGMEPEIGIHPGVWSLDRLRAETEDEWRWLSMTIGDSEWLETLRKRWDEALEEGTLFEFSPIFYALARAEL